MFSSFGLKAGSEAAKWLGIGEGLNHNQLDAGEKHLGVLDKELFSYSTNQPERSNPKPIMTCFPMPSLQNIFI